MIATNINQRIMKNKFNANNKEVPFHYIGSNFEKWFGDMEVPTIAKMESLKSMKLPRSMHDKAILEELKPEPVTLSEVYKTLEIMDKNTWALFYVRDKDGVLRVVCVRWVDGGWRVVAYEVSSPLVWFVGNQVFSRKFGLSTSETSTDPLELSSFDPVDILYIKYRDELTGITCKHYGNKVTLETSDGKPDFWFKKSDKETVIKVCESIIKLCNQK